MFSFSWGQGRTVYLLARDERRGRETMQQLQKETGSTKIEFFRVDLADLNTIFEFAKGVEVRAYVLFVISQSTHSQRALSASYLIP